MNILLFTSPGSIAFSLGPITIHWYGIIIAFAIVAAYSYTVYELKRRHLPTQHFESMVTWIVLAGVIGARLYYVLFNLESYATAPLEALKIWKGGLAIHGALLGGGMAFFIYSWRHKLSPLVYLDVLLPGVLAAQAIGRWGNFFNNEAFGTPTSLPWKLYIPEMNRPEQHADFSYFHPTFLYESLWNVLGFFLLMYLGRRLYPSEKNPPGVILACYLIWYSFGRFFIEALRTDSLYIGPFRAAQLMSLLLFLLGISILGFLKIYKIRKPI